MSWLPPPQVRVANPIAFPLSRGHPFPMKIPGLRAADEMVGGLAHFGRMLDKIRLAAADALPD